MKDAWVICVFFKFDLLAFDEWLDGLDDCPAKRELSDRRRRLDEWLEKHGQFKLNLEDEDSCAALKRHVEFLKVRWREIAHDNAKMRYTRIGLKRSRKQSDSGKRGAEARWAGVQGLSDIYEMLAKQTDELDDWIPASDLWLEFNGILDCANLHPKEIEHETDVRKDVIAWGSGEVSNGEVTCEIKAGKITRGRFENKMSELRNRT